MIDLASEELLGVSQIAELLYISKSAVYNLIEDDKTFPVIRVGGSWKVLRSDLNQWIDVKRAKTDQE